MLAFYSLYIFAWLLHLLPHRIIIQLGNALGYLLYYLVKKPKHLAFVNLSLCFPDLSKKEKHRLIRQNFQYFCSAILEYGTLLFASPNKIRQFIKVEGYEHYEAVQDRPLIVFTPHFSGLDIGGVRLSMLHQVAAIYAKQKNPHIEAFFLRVRTRFNQPLLFRRGDGIWPILRALRSKRILYYLPDQDLGDKGNAYFVPFFATQASTIDALSRIAKAAKATILPTVCRRENGHYVLRYYPAWENFPTEDIQVDIKRMNAFIEERILETPAQYLWVQKRFKTQADGTDPYINKD